MARENKKIEKKKSEKNSKENRNSNVEDKLFNGITVVFIVFVVLAIFYLITLMIVGMPFKKEKNEVNFDYKEILAGSSFNRKDKEYYVLYYDFSNSELNDLLYAVNEYENQHESNKIYLVNLNEGLNKKYISSKDSNKKPNNVNDLAIKGPTLILFKSNKVETYVEGKDDIISYLK